MKADAVAAYDDAELVRRYDADMDVMHPNRAHMARVVGEWLDLPEDAPARFLDLGTGTGYLARTLLDRFPRARLAAIDGAQAMISLARARLAAVADRVEFVAADFRDPASVFGEGEPPLDAVVSSFALHHLGREEKARLLAAARAALRPGAGWFLNADIVRAADDSLNARVQALRVRGIVARSKGRDPRFRTEESTRATIEGVERRDGDRPLPLEEDLALLAEAGFSPVAPLWVEYREAVTAGRAPRGAGR
jgi:trans-aconitate methyltransferase